MDEQNPDILPQSTVTESNSNHPSSSPVSTLNSEQLTSSQDSVPLSDETVARPVSSNEPTSNMSNPVVEPQSDKPLSSPGLEIKSDQPTTSPVSGETSDQPEGSPVSEPNSDQSLPKADSEPNSSDQTTVNQVSGETPDQPRSSTVSQPKSDKPPSYNSVFGQLKDARATSDGNVMAVKKSFSIISKSMGCTILLLIILAIPVSMIVIGSVYLNDCPAERFIPIYLIVGGCFTIISDIFSLIQKCRSGDPDEEQKGGLAGACSGIIGCFLFAWFICGNVWIYRAYGSFSTEVKAPNYCHPTLLYYSFWLLTSTYIIMGLSCVLVWLGSIIVTVGVIFPLK